jgi:hypothetical protein
MGIPIGVIPPISSRSGGWKESCASPIAMAREEPGRKTSLARRVPDDRKNAAGGGLKLSSPGPVAFPLGSLGTSTFTLGGWALARSGFDGC